MAVKNQTVNLPEPFAPGVLPEGIRSRFVHVNGLRMHILEAGYETPERACVFLLHGFPELAYTWRKNMLPLAEQGFHVIAPDLRGFGRTTGWEDGYDVDITPFAMTNHVRDMVALAAVLGHRQVHAVIGHDSGSPTAAHCALIRPDIFRSLVMMAAPFAGVPQLPLGSEYSAVPLAENPVNEALAALEHPRKHYQVYYTTRQAAADMITPPQGVHALLRAYFHYKSADWKGNHPHCLSGWTAEALAEMPTYYIMELDKTMGESVAPFMPTEEEIRACKWLTEEELAVYSSEYARTGFQGGLNLYRTSAGGLNKYEMRLFSGRTIDVPSMFIAGTSDWCAYQSPGALETMARQVCTDFRGCHFVEGAGHWVQQEQPEKTNELLLQFLGKAV